MLSRHIWLAFSFVVLLHLKNALSKDPLLCAFHYNQMSHFSIETSYLDDVKVISEADDATILTKNNILTDVTAKHNSTGAPLYERCSHTDFCYAFWQTNVTDNGTVSNVILGQGCWAGSNTVGDCDRSECISDKKPPKSMSNSKFCCCSTNFCNVKFIDKYVPVSENDAKEGVHPTTEHLEQIIRQENQHVVMVFILFCSIALVVVGVCFYRVRNVMFPSYEKDGADSTQFIKNDAKYTDDVYNVDHLKLLDIIGQGRYGTVWHGIVNDHDVAVKVFPAHQKNVYCNERDIYMQSFMDNPTLLGYFGCDDRINVDGNNEYFLFLAYIPLGCLQDYLRNNVIDWATFCKMSLSVAKGLAHLHSPIKKGDEFKPSICHRDLNTRNILVKPDLSCCLCDLGFAMKIYPRNNADSKEMKNLNEVGTVRYMAPEVLEGAVNLLDKESALKQIDVYALGLVMWELSTRCKDLYPSEFTVPIYKLPFEHEIGIHPSFEQMQTLVSRHKARPLWPYASTSAIWSHSATHRLIRDTTEDCWDQDAEARLTALCVEQRLNELAYIKERTALSPSTKINAIINNNHLNTINCTVQSALNTPGDSTMSTSQQSIDKSEYSRGTVETIYTLSPSENPDVNVKNSNELVVNQHVNELQPFQGRNRCLERNLLTTTDDTSELIDKSIKHEQILKQQKQSAIVQAVDDYKTKKSTQIAFVQNITDSSHNSDERYVRTVKSNAKRLGILNEIKRLFKVRERKNGADVVENGVDVKTDDAMLLAGENCASVQRLHNQLNVMDTQVNLVAPNCYNKNFQNSNTVTNLNIRTSLFVNETANDAKKRPTNLPLIKTINERAFAHASRDEQKSLLDDAISCHETTPAVEKIASGISQVVKMRGAYGQLQREPSIDYFNKVFSSTSDLSRLKDPSLRVKTPGDVPPSVRRIRGLKSKNGLGNTRFSLYDDRMMDGDVVMNGNATSDGNVNDDDQQILYQNSDGTFNMCSKKLSESTSSF